MVANAKVPNAQCDNVGESQGYMPISIRYEKQEMHLTSGLVGIVPAMVTHWTFTPDELAALANGAVLKIEVLGEAWPPCKITVDLPQEAQGSA